MGTWIFLGIVVALALWAVSIYNTLVSLANRYRTSTGALDCPFKLFLLHILRVPPIKKICYWGSPDYI